jgi:hypothetical protein
MCVAFVNFNGVLIETIKNLPPSEEEIDFSRSEFFQLKIYELYFVKHITNHFDRVFKFLVNKEEMYLSYIKFKNMYVVDLSTGEILFDILSIRNSNKNKKIYKNEKLWQEILHHSKNLMENYKSENGNQFDNKDGYFRFVKFECTSTYPRLTFIIKYLPILKGISIIHVYSQKKLSRMSENSDQHLTHKGYKEIDLFYGSEVKNNNNIEFRYTEPRKLQEIEKFFIEFFISIRNSTDIYYDVNHELKYFDYSIITAINEILISHRENLTKENGANNNNGNLSSPNENQLLSREKLNSIESLITKINNKLYENFLSMRSNTTGNERSQNDNDDLKPIELNTNNYERDTNSSYNFLLIKKENILTEMFIIPTENNREGNMSNINDISRDATGRNHNQVNIPKAQYVEHEDGWAMRTKGNGFGFDIMNNTNNGNKSINKSKSMNYQTKGNFALGPLNTSNNGYIENASRGGVKNTNHSNNINLINQVNNNTLNITQIEGNNNLANNVIPIPINNDSSLEFEKKISLSNITKLEDDSKIYLRGNSLMKAATGINSEHENDNSPRKDKLQKNYANDNGYNMIKTDNSFHTIDYYLCELENKNVNKEKEINVHSNARHNLNLNNLNNEKEFITSSTPKEREVINTNDAMNGEIPKHNVLESLLRQNTRSVNQSGTNNNANNLSGSQQAKLNYNLNLNIPMSNLNTINKKETLNNNQNNPSGFNTSKKLALYDAGAEGETPPVRVNIVSNNNVTNFKQNNNNPAILQLHENNTSLNQFKALEFVQVSQNNIKGEKNLSLNTQTQNNVNIITTNNRLIDDGEQESREHKDSSTSNAVGKKKIKMK